MANNKLNIKTSANTTEALERIKEVTEAANECVVASGKPEKVMGNFINRNKQEDITVGLVLDGKVMPESIIRNIRELDEIRKAF
nr:hypothetical protein [Bacillus cereus]